MAIEIPDIQPADRERSVASTNPAEADWWNPVHRVLLLRPTVHRRVAMAWVTCVMTLSADREQLFLETKPAETGFQVLFKGFGNFFCRIRSVPASGILSW